MLLAPLTDKGPGRKEGARERTGLDVDHVVHIGQVVEEARVRKSGVERAECRRQRDGDLQYRKKGTGSALGSGETHKCPQ